MKKIAIFASGSGSNAEEIIRRFASDDQIEVGLVVSNNPQAYVLTRAQNHQIPTLIIDRKSFYNSESLLDVFTDAAIDFIVLAGFMWLVPSYLIQAYNNKIINIHPALLPSYGGKGMYGMHVHRAVKEAGEHETGITIHLVNEFYDEGKIILQKRCPIEKNDTPEDIAAKVHQLEYEYYPQVIETVVKNT